MKFGRNFIINILLLSFIAGCGIYYEPTAEEKRASAVLSAKNYLTLRKCDLAINVLKEAVWSDTDAEFIQVYASAYACKAGFSEPVFFGSDISKFTEASGGSSPLSGLAKFSTSDMDGYDDEKYEYLQQAIDMLLYAGGIPANRDPTPARRREYFSDQDSGNINVQLFYMLLAQLGKYVKYYGNADDNGEKGAGSGTNVCFVNYRKEVRTNPAFEAQGSCPKDISDTVTNGNALLGQQNNLNVERLCQGIVLMNNLMEVLPYAIAALSGSSAASIDLDILDAAFAAAPDTELTSVLSLTRCNNPDTGANTWYSQTAPYELELYFYFIFESLLKDPDA